MTRAELAIACGLTSLLTAMGAIGAAWLAARGDVAAIVERLERIETAVARGLPGSVIGGGGVRAGRRAHGVAVRGTVGSHEIPGGASWHVRRNLTR